jgi:hypothetical protein
MAEKLSPIPPMTDPLGRYWDQPNRDAIAVDETQAMMTKDTLLALLDYSASIPSGVYPGKMWRCDDRNGGWLLVWYGTEREGRCSINRRKVILV